MTVIDKKSIAEFLNEFIPEISQEEIESYIEIPPGDMDYNYSFPCFKLAKIEKKAPNVIAEDLMKKIESADFLEEVKAVGPYLNLKVKAKNILHPIFELGEDYGRIRLKLGLEEKKKLRIVIEYPAPNTNKSLHFGHVRNMLLGKSLSNLLIYKGHHVFQVNLYNNRGIHICQSMLAYDKWGNNKDPDKKSDHFVGDYYVKFNEKLKQNKELEKEAYELLRKWEANDKKTISLWEKMNKWAIDGFKETFKKFKISFDKVYYESDIYLKGKDIILKGLQEGLFEQIEDGAIVARLKDKYNLEDKFLIRSDGTSIYITQDIYLAYLKMKDFQYDRSIYVVGDPQIQHFKWLFAILDMLGFKEDNYHLAYGMISLPSGRMKSREGTTVEADDIIEEVESLAFKEVEERYPDLSNGEKKRRAEIISQAAIRFFILKFNAAKWFLFKPDESISFEGETGPYIQYCYARISSIISKSGKKISPDINWDLFSHKDEWYLIKQLNYFPEVLDSAEQTYSVHLIAQYLLNLCQGFNSFYSSCQVISDNKELEKARLLLIKCVQIVVKTGLNILGIEPLENM